MQVAVKGALDEQWQRLKFGKLVNQVVPFLPLEPAHIQQIIDLKLRDLGEQLEGRYILYSLHWMWRGRGRGRGREAHAAFCAGTHRLSCCSGGE